MKADTQLASFLARFDPEVASMARAALARMRALVPGATELVYDAYNALSIGFGVSDELAGAFIHVAVYPRHVNLGFNRGVDLDDPKGMLQGVGARIRHIKLADERVLKSADVARLVREAAGRAGFVPGPKGQRGPILVKAIYAKQRPRTPAR